MSNEFLTGNDISAISVTKNKNKILTREHKICLKVTTFADFTNGQMG
jgi:hypothetical protein